MISPRSFKYYALVVAGLLAAIQFVTPSQTRESRSVAVLDTETKTANSAAETPSAKLLKLAESLGQSAPLMRLIEYTAKNQPTVKTRYMVVVDFNRPSTEKRMFVFDSQTGLAERFYVAHGKGSEGATDDGIAEAFSNEDGSSSSSLGIYRALDEYTGAHGRSMRLQGLEASNSNAFARAIVFHRADYVSEDFVQKTGRLGRSNGCLAVEPAVADGLIDKLRNNAYIIAWKR
jgi:hypothetical protein